MPTSRRRQRSQRSLFARIIQRCREPITLNHAAHNWLLGAKAVADYALFRRGYFAIPAISAGAFIKAHPSSETPDIQCSIALYSIHNLGDWVDSFSGFTITATLLRPESRGHVRIKSADPRQAPAIHPNYLATQKDRDTLLSGVKALRRLAKAPALARHIVEEVDPGPACEGDDGLMDFIRGRGSTVYHPVTTCRMGQDAKAVVDERLKVRGFERLRVIDAHHAGGRVRQHQCGDHHDRREGRGHGPRGCPGGNNKAPKSRLEPTNAG